MHVLDPRSLEKTEHKNCPSNCVYGHLLNLRIKSAVLVNIFEHH